jgi:long-chain acyl-CoA synthetase
VLGGERTSYAALDTLACRLAGLLRAHGVRAGDCVGILLPNGPAFVGAYYGALRLGAVAVPLNPLLKPPEVRQRLEHAGARVLVASAPTAAGLGTSPGTAVLDPALAGGSDPVSAIADRDDADTAVILYTSGTVGDAKGAALTHAGLRAKAAFLAGPVLRLDARDVVLGVAPFAHVFGMSGVMNPAIVAGACMALMDRFDALAALELMRRSAVTVFLGVPTMCVSLLKATEGPDSASPPALRLAHVGGAPLAPETLAAFAERFSCEFLEGYGMTETSGAITSHRAGQRCRPGSVGTPADGLELRLADAEGVDVPDGDVGEVLVRGDGLMSGYWRNPEATAAAFRDGGWLCTGDLGRRDEDGYLFLVDRKKDVILRGGYSVYPREVEDALYAHPGVLEAVVVGVPDETLGEEIVAIVVPRPGRDCEPDDVSDFVRERIAAYKCPRLVVTTGDLPRGGSGKILKRELDREALRRALDEQRDASDRRRSASTPGRG